jgi:hypothetical protein
MSCLAKPPDRGCEGPGTFTACGYCQFQPITREQGASPPTPSRRLSHERITPPRPVTHQGPVAPIASVDLPPVLVRTASIPDPEEEKEDAKMAKIKRLAAEKPTTGIWYTWGPAQYLELWVEAVRNGTLKKHAIEIPKAQNNLLGPDCM